MSVSPKRCKKCVVRISPLRHSTLIDANINANIEAFMQTAKSKCTDRSQMGEDALWKTFCKQKFKRKSSKQHKQATETKFRHMYKQVFQTNLTVHDAIQDLDSNAKLQAIKTQASTRSSPRSKAIRRIFPDNGLETDAEDKVNNPDLLEVPKTRSRIQNTKKRKNDSELTDSENISQTPFVESSNTSIEMQPTVGLERLNIHLSRKTQYQGVPFLKSVLGVCPTNKISFLEDSERPTKTTRKAAARNLGSIDMDDKHGEMTLPARMTRRSQKAQKGSGDIALNGAKRETRAVTNQTIPATSKGSIAEGKEIVTLASTRKNSQNVAEDENQSAKRVIAEMETDSSVDSKARKRMKRLESKEREVVSRMATRSSPMKKPENVTVESEYRSNRASSSRIVSKVSHSGESVEFQRGSKDRDSDADADSESEDHVPKVAKSSKKKLEQDKEYDQRSGNQRSTRKSFNTVKNSNKKEMVQDYKRKEFSADDNDDQARRSSPRRKSHTKENKVAGEKQYFHRRQLFDSSSDESDTENRASMVKDKEYTGRLSRSTNKTSRIQTRNLRSSSKETKSSVTPSTRRSATLKTITFGEEESSGEEDCAESVVKPKFSHKHPAKQESSNTLPKHRQSPRKSAEGYGHYDSDNEDDEPQTTTISPSKYPRRTRSSVTQQLSSQSSDTATERASRKMVSSKSHGDYAGDSGIKELTPKETQQSKRSDAKTSNESGTSSDSMHLRKSYPFRSSRADARRFGDASARKSTRKVALNTLTSQRKETATDKFEDESESDAENRSVKQLFTRKTRMRVESDDASSGLSKNVRNSRSSKLRSGSSDSDNDDEINKDAREFAGKKPNTNKVDHGTQVNMLESSEDAYTDGDDETKELEPITKTSKLKQKSNEKQKPNVIKLSVVKSDNKLSNEKTDYFSTSPSTTTSSESDGKDVNTRRTRRQTALKEHQAEVEDVTKQIVLRQRKSKKCDVNESERSQKSGRILRLSRKSYTENTSESSEEIFTESDDGTIRYKSAGKTRTLSKKSNDNQDVNKNTKIKSNDDIGSEDDKEHSPESSDHEIEKEQHVAMSKYPSKRLGKSKSFRTHIASSESDSEGGKDRTSEQKTTSKELKTAEFDDDETSEDNSKQRVLRNRQPRKPQVVETVKGTEYSRVLRKTPQRSGHITEINVSSESSEDALSESEDDAKTSTQKPKSDEKSPRVRITRCDTSNSNVRNTRQTSRGFEHESTDEDGEVDDGNRYAGVLRKRPQRVDRNDKNESSDDSLTENESESDDMEGSSRKKSKEEVADGSACDLTTAMSRYSNERQRKLSRQQKLGGKTNEHQEEPCLPDNADDSSSKVIPGASDVAVDSEDDSEPSPKTDVCTTVSEGKSPAQSRRKQILPLDSDEEVTETRPAEIKVYPLRSNKRRSRSPIARIEMDVDNDAGESTPAVNDEIIKPAETQSEERQAAKLSTQTASKKVIVSSKRRLGIKDILEQFAESSSDESQVVKNTNKKKTNVITDDSDSQCEEPEAIPQLVPISVDIEDEETPCLNVGEPTSPTTPLRATEDNFFPSLTDDEQATQATAVVEDSDNESIGAICRFLNVNEPSKSPPVPLMTQNITSASLVENTDVQLDGQPEALAPCDDFPKVVSNDGEDAKINKDLKSGDPEVIVQQDVDVAVSSETNSKLCADESKMSGEEDAVAPSQDNCHRKIKIVLDKIDDIPNSSIKIETVTIEDSDADTEIFPLESHLKSLEVGDTGESSSCLVLEHADEDTSLVGCEKTIDTKTADDRECCISDLNVGEEVQCESGDCNQEVLESGSNSAGDLFALDDCWETCSETSLSKKELDKGLDNSAGTSTTPIPPVEGLQKLEYDEEKELQRLKKLKRYVRETGVNISFSSLFHEDDTTLDKSKKLVKVLRDNGMQGKPTFMKCRAIREQRESKKDSDKADVPDADSAMGTRIAHRIYASSGIFRASPIQKQGNQTIQQ